MRYVSLMIAVTMGLLLTSGCQEDKPQTQPTAQQAPAETMDQAKQSTAETMDQAKQVDSETMDHAKQEAHKAMDAAHETMKEAHEGMKMTAEANEEALAAGQAIYEKNCAACHTTGLAGAPKLGDKAAWTPLNAKEIDQLVHVAIKGKGAMPPQGGNFSLSDEEIHAAVSYMMDKGR